MLCAASAILKVNFSREIQTNVRWEKAFGWVVCIGRFSGSFTICVAFVFCNMSMKCRREMRNETFWKDCRYFDMIARPPPTETIKLIMAFRELIRAVLLLFDQKVSPHHANSSARKGASVPALTWPNWIIQIMLHTWQRLNQYLNKTIIEFRMCGTHFWMNFITQFIRHSLLPSSSMLLDTTFSMGLSSLGLARNWNTTTCPFGEDQGKGHRLRASCLAKSSAAEPLAGNYIRHPSPDWVLCRTKENN